MHSLPLASPPSPSGAEARSRAPWQRLLPEGVERRPSWLRVRPPTGAGYAEVRDVVRGLELVTVCEEARCPNLGECWSQGTATFMILGDVCTRHCAFCAVKSGRRFGDVDADEPRRVAEAIAAMGLRHAVVTSVDRDDLPDYGAAHFAATITAIRERSPGTTVEVLTPDFNGSRASLEIVLAARPEIFNHNVETVGRLYPRVRPKADLGQSLGLLQAAKRLEPSVRTKSGFMLGLGETESEVLELLHQLREHDVEVVTIGQYLRPTPRHYPVVRYVTPEEFAELREVALRLGFLHVEAGPLVRSSYHAGEHARAVTRMTTGTGNVGPGSRSGLAE